MSDKQCEREFERRLFNLLRTYSEYSIVKRKIASILKDPETYVREGSLTIPTYTAEQEHAALQKAKNSLLTMLIEQSGDLNEPLMGRLPERLPYDLTYTPKTVHEILDAVCQFVTAAVKPGFSSVCQGDVEIYAEDIDRY